MGRELPPAASGRSCSSPDFPVWDRRGSRHGLRGLRQGAGHGPQTSRPDRSSTEPQHSPELFVADLTKDAQIPRPAGILAAMTVPVPRFPALAIALLGSLALASAARAELQRKPAGDPVVVRDDAVSTLRERPASLPMTAPRLVSARVDWAAATRALAVNSVLRPAATAARIEPSRLGRPAPVPAPLLRINAAMAQRFAGIAQSPVPVLLPFDTDRLLHRSRTGHRNIGQHGLSQRLQSAPVLLLSRAVRLRRLLRTSRAERARRSKTSNSASRSRSSSRARPALRPRRPEGFAAAHPVPELESEFPGIRRLIHEHHLRYTFVRFGVPYAVSIACFDGRRRRATGCRPAATPTRVVRHFLRVAARRRRHAAAGRGRIEPMPIVAAAPAASPSFSYSARGGCCPAPACAATTAAPTAPSIRRSAFRCSMAPAFVNSQLFQSRNRPIEPGHEPNYAYPWRDNFCERRGFPVGQCPGGHGHQGQDLRPALCEDGSRRPAGRTISWPCATARSCARPARRRSISSSTPSTEHLRFRYLHMDPSKMDRRRRAQRAAGARGRGDRGRCRTSADARAARAIICTSTCRFRPVTAGCSSIPT